MTAITRAAAGALLFIACTGPDDLTVDSAEQAVSVTWTNAVGVAAAGNDLTKTGTTAGWNAGASSVETLAGDGFVELTTAEATTAKMVGLGNGDASRHYADIEFAIQLRANGTVAVYESGTLRGSFGAYAAGDVFRIEVAAGALTYWRNGVTFYSSALAPGFPLVVDTSLYTPGATIDDVVLVATSFEWENAVGVAVDGRDLTKTIAGVWNGGASSVQTLEADGFLEFTTAENTTGKMIGLSSDDSSQHYSDIDFALYLKANGSVAVYEGGLLRAASIGSYVAGDRFRIAVLGGVVTYSQNGSVPLYTSTSTPSFPLRADTSFLTPGGTVRDVRLTSAAAECPGYGGGGLVCPGSYVVTDQDDLAAIASCANITGSLTIDAPEVAVIGLPALERVGGSILITGGLNLLRVRLPSLKEVGGLRFSGVPPPLAGFDLSRLQTGGDIQLGTATDLDLHCLVAADDFQATEVAIPRLADVRGTLSGADLAAPALESVGGHVTAERLNAPGLGLIGGTLVYGDGTSVPALERAGGLHLRDAASIDLPVLVEITGELRGGTPPCFAAGTEIPTAATVTLPALERAGAIRLCTGNATQAESWPLTDVSLPVLQRVTGGLSIGESGLINQLAFPSLVSVGGMSIYFPTDLPVLESSGSMVVNAATTAPALREVTGALGVNASLSADALETVTLDVSTERTSTVSLASLARVGGLRAYRTTASVLTTLDLPALTTVDGGGSGDVEIRNTSLTELSLPVLTSIQNDLLIVRNRNTLTDIELPSLVSLGTTLQIERNDVLPTCQATDLEAQLRAAGWAGTAIIAGNGTGSCP